MCIYSYLVQKYKMYLYNQLQMTTFLFVALPMRIMQFIDMLLADCHSKVFLYLIPYKPQIRRASFGYYFSLTWQNCGQLFVANNFVNMLNTSVADSRTNIIIFDIPFKMIRTKTVVKDHLSVYNSCLAQCVNVFICDA